jgi:chromosomal replication initiator protein
MTPRADHRDFLYAALDATSAVTRVPARQILARRRVAHIVEARHVVMWIVREFTDASLPTIAMLFGGLDHTTVLNAHRRITKRLSESEPMQRTVAHILALMSRNEEEKRAA